ncbi:MAG TPA: sigma factor-like helix-turn-helix DNA-binding protein [Kofleriaceae bacterium]|nr:sigma factor-like helix-turn-helix DNA-binding protein [Kofleriaceae bacterium]
MSCRHHLYLEVTFAGSIKLQYPGREPWEMSETCSLDVADQGEHSMSEVGELIGVAKERIRQNEDRALLKLEDNKTIRELRDGPQRGPC